MILVTNSNGSLNNSAKLLETIELGDSNSEKNILKERSLKNLGVEKSDVKQGTGKMKLVRELFCIFSFFAKRTMLFLTFVFKFPDNVDVMDKKLGKKRDNLFDVEEHFQNDIILLTTLSQFYGVTTLKTCISIGPSWMVHE